MEETLNAELNLIKPSASVLMDFKEIQKTSALRLVVEPTRTAHLMKSVIVASRPPKLENANVYAYEILVLLEHLAQLKITERYARAILH